MTSQYRHRRTSSAATAFPNPLEPGEIAVNTANRQIAIGDAQSGVIGAPLPAIAVRYFDIRAQYVANDFVQNGTSIYRAKGPISPGPFNIANWDMMVGSVDPQYVLKAGDTMSGMLSLPATVPSIGTHATNKTYVDTGLAGKSTIYSATSPPAGVADNSMWFETDTGLLYVRYNDGNTSQWVIACPQPDISNFVLRSGDNMSGPLGVPVTPTLPAHATSKSYVDAQLAGKSSIISSDTPPPGAIDNSLWYETDSGATYVRYNDLNGGAQWVAIADPAAVAYAAPFDALAYNGMQVNGSMEVSQERGTGSTAGANNFICDNWRFLYGGTMVMSGAMSNGYTAIPGFTSVVFTTVSTALASMGAGDYAMLWHSIEGYRTIRLGWGGASAQPITIAFWSAHARTGVYSVAVRNAIDTRSYTFTYTQAVASTPQYNVATIPGCTDGVWNWDNGVGIKLVFPMAMGSSNTAPSANTWLAANYSAAPGQVNAVAATSDIFRLTGVVVLPGLEAPSAARSPLIMRPYDQELLTCQRYWESSYATGVAVGTAPVSGSFIWVQNGTGGNGNPPTVFFRAIKRSSPTVIFYNPMTGASGQIRSISNSANLPSTPIDVSTHGWQGANGTRVHQEIMQLHYTADARL